LVDLDFRNVSDATNAAQALMSQVFIDGPLGNFGAQPDITNGCHDPVNCLVLIPYALSGASTVELATAFNSSVEAVDQAGDLGASTHIANSTVFSAVFVYAKFDRMTLVPPRGLPGALIPALPLTAQAVPIPGVPLLFLGGALCATFGLLRRGRKPSLST
jgi:hypothetical protein